MNNSETNNPLMDDGDFPFNMPPPQQAWADMRKRLDDEMPAAGLPLPGSVINVDNGFLRSIMSLFALLLISTAGLLFTSKTFTAFSNLKNTRHTPAQPGAQSKPVGGNSASNNTNANGSPAAQNNPLQNTGLAATRTGAAGTVAKKQTGIYRAKFNGTTAANEAATGNISGNTVKPGYSSPQNATAATTETPKQPDTAHLANNNKPVAQPPVAGDEEEKKDGEDDEKQWQAGLGWQAQVPFSSTQHYFAGPNASSQPYRLLLPGIWVSLKDDKQLLELELNPFASTVYAPNPFIYYARQVDAQTIVAETRKINKLFGISLAAGYSYNAHGNWWAGVRLQPKLLTSGVATGDIASTTNSNTTYYKTFAPINDTDWQYITKFQVKLEAQVLYMAPRWQAGIRAGVYFTPMAQNYGSGKNPLEVQLFYRRALWNKVKK